MSLEPMISLAEAARIAGVGRKTFRRWLRVDLGIEFPPAPRGSKRLIRRYDAQRVIELHSGYVNFTALQQSRRRAEKGAA